MLNVTIRDNGFSIFGHAEFAEYGSDIVCSAVSFLAQTLAEELHSLDNITVHKERGMMDVTFKNSGDISIESKTLLEYFENAVRKLSQQYPKNIQINKVS